MAVMNAIAPNGTGADAALAHVDRQLEASLERLFALLRIPSVSTQPEHAEDCRRAAAWL
jgi:acetylornithine deacetylase/succinyl-diaminopimelate desuccinylase-like protein